jgi:hypothetical protein
MIYICGARTAQQHGTAVLLLDGAGLLARPARSWRVHSSRRRQSTAVLLSIMRTL